MAGSGETNLERVTAMQQKGKTPHRRGTACTFKPSDCQETCGTHTRQHATNTCTNGSGGIRAQPLGDIPFPRSHICRDNVQGCKGVGRRPDGSRSNESVFRFTLPRFHKVNCSLDVCYVAGLIR